MNDAVYCTFQIASLPSSISFITIVSLSFKQAPLCVCVCVLVNPQVTSILSIFFEIIL